MGTWSYPSGERFPRSGGEAAKWDARIRLWMGGESDGRSERIRQGQRRSRRDLRSWNRPVHGRLGRLEPGCCPSIANGLIIASAATVWNVRQLSTLLVVGAAVERHSRLCAAAEHCIPGGEHLS